jgi:hypothetical protein
MEEVLQVKATIRIRSGSSLSANNDPLYSRWSSVSPEEE